jgi:hypothetical protein
VNGRDLTLGLVAGLAVAGAARRRGSRATTPLPNAFSETEIGILTRKQYLDLRNPGEKFHPESAYDFDLAKLNRPRRYTLATHSDRNKKISLLATGPEASTGYILEDETGVLGVLHRGTLYHGIRLRPASMPRTFWPVREYQRRDPITLDIQRTEAVKYPEDKVSLVDDVRANNRAHYSHLLQRIRVKGAPYTIRSEGAPVPNKGTSIAILDADDQVVARASNEWGATLLTVATELRGKGLGPILGEVWYTYNPIFRSGGMTTLGKRNALRMWEARVRTFLDRGWYSELVKTGRMTKAQVDAIFAGLDGKRAPSDLPAPRVDPQASTLLLYVDGPAFVLYDARFLTDPDEQWIRGYGFFRDAPRVGTFLYRIEYDRPWKIQTTLAALQIARDAGWPIWVGEGYGDLLELDGIPSVTRTGDHVALTEDLLPVRALAAAERKARKALDPYREQESLLLETAEAKWQ